MPQLDTNPRRSRHALPFGAPPLLALLGLVLGLLPAYSIAPRAQAQAPMSPGSWRHHTCGDCITNVVLTDDAVWAGTMSAGLIRHDLRTGAVSQTTVEDGLPGRGVVDLDVAPDGDIWAVLRSTYVQGDRVGIGHWDGQGWQRHGLAEGLPSLDVVQVLGLDGHRALARTDAGLAAYDGRAWALQSSFAALDGRDLRWLARSEAGQAFAATDGGLFAEEGRRWLAVDTAALPSNDLRWVGFGAEGRVWLLGPDFLASSPDPAQTGGRRLWTLHPALPPPTDDQVPLRMAGIDGRGRPWAVDLATAHILEGERWASRDLERELGMPSKSLWLAGSYNQQPPLAFGQNDQLWLGHVNTGLARFDGQGWLAHPSGIGPITLIAFSVKAAPEGGVWLGHFPLTHPDHLLDRYDGRAWNHIGQAQGLPTRGILGVTQSNLDVEPSGRVWLASDGSAEEGGWLAWREGTRWRQVSTRDAFGVDRSILCVTADGLGGVWLGTENGAIHFHPDHGVTARYTVVEGLPSNDVRAIAIDRRGGAERIWVGTTAGVARIDAAGLTVLTQADGLGAEPTGAILVDEARGAVWFASAVVHPTVVSRLDHMGWTVYDTDDGLEGDGFWSLELGPDGQIWGAISDQSSEDRSGLARFDGRRWSIIREADGLLSNDIFDVAVDDRGTVWAATIAGLSELRPEGSVPSPSPTPTAPPPGGCVCATARRLAPPALVNAILADPGRLGGYGEPRDPGKPAGPFNPPRQCLGIHNAGLAYHPLFNPLAWKAGCP